MNNLQGIKSVLPLTLLNLPDSPHSLTPHSENYFVIQTKNIFTDANKTIMEKYFLRAATFKNTQKDLFLREN